MSDEKGIAISQKTYSIDSPQQLSSLAVELKKFIVKQELYSKIKGKNYVNVEGWQFAGACTGIVPIIKSVEKVESTGEIKYRAEVELINIKSGQQVGFGVAVCSNKEKNKTSFEEYAIASMAQTRAIGKAYRNIFAWLMKMAGYEATPAEEVVEYASNEGVNREDDNKPAKPNQISTIEKIVNGMTDEQKASFEEFTTKGMTQGQARDKINELLAIKNKKGK